MTIPRRNLLSMLAITPFIIKHPRWALKQGVQASTVGRNHDFYVWVHGIFGITFKKDLSGISLVSPSLTSPRNRHLYKVGRVTQYDGQTKTFIGATDIPNITTFRFKGLKNQETTSPQERPGPMDKLAIKGSLTYGQPDMLYFELPYPQAIIPLRFAKAKAYSTSPPDAEPNQTNLPPDGDLVVPLTHVFRYDAVDPKDVELVYMDSAGKPATLGDPSQYNHFHLYAEPDPSCYHNSPCHNASGALEALLDCYRSIPEFGLEQEQLCPDLQNITSFSDDLREQFGLFEWAGECRVPDGSVQSGPQKTISAHECPQLMVTEV